jgi:hypothetical protein
LKSQRRGLPHRPSSVLGENLEISGFARPPNSAAHHIVAGDSSNKYAILARDKLKAEGIDINEYANGVFLPKSSKYVIDDAVAHSKVHTDKYYKAVYDKLQGAPDSRSALQEIAEELKIGKFPY